MHSFPLRHTIPCCTCDLLMTHFHPLAVNIKGALFQDQNSLAPGVTNQSTVFSFPHYKSTALCVQQIRTVCCGVLADLGGDYYFFFWQLITMDEMKEMYRNEQKSGPQQLVRFSFFIFRYPLENEKHLISCYLHLLLFLYTGPVYVHRQYVTQVGTVLAQRFRTSLIMSSGFITS